MRQSCFFLIKQRFPVELGSVYDSFFYKYTRKEKKKQDDQGSKIDTDDEDGGVSRQDWS